MIETPTATAIIRTSEEPKSEKELDSAPLIEQELLLIKNPPVTSNLHTTISHIRSIAGPFALFRGFHVLAFYALAFHALSSCFLHLFPYQSAFFSSIVFVVTSTLLCRFHATWTHIAISNPSPKRWYRRVPDRTLFRKLAGPTFVAATVEQIAVFVPLKLYNEFQLQRYVTDPQALAALTDAERITVWVHFVLVLLAGLTTTLVLLIPAHAALNRVQASLLPEEDTAIVPFDRTFGGKVIPEGRLTLKEAWKSFDLGTKVRVYKVYAKVAAMQGALLVGFVLVCAVEMRLVLGDQLDKAVRAAAGGRV